MPKRKCHLCSACEGDIRFCPMALREFEVNVFMPFLISLRGKGTLREELKSRRRSSTQKSRCSCQNTIFNVLLLLLHNVTRFASFSVSFCGSLRGSPQQMSEGCFLPYRPAGTFRA